MRALLALAVVAAAAPVSAEVDLSGNWERYPTVAAPDSVDPRFAPTPIPDPPLKPEFKAAWDLQQKKLAQRIEDDRPRHIRTPGVLFHFAALGSRAHRQEDDRLVGRLLRQRRQLWPLITALGAALFKEVQHHRFAA